MKAHKTDDTNTRLALLEQSNEYTIKTMQDIKYQIHTLNNDMKSEFKNVGERFDKSEERFDSKIDGTNSKIDSFRKDMNTKFDKIENRIYFVLFGFCASVVSYVVAKVYHLI